MRLVLILSLSISFLLFGCNQSTSQTSLLLSKQLPENEKINAEILYENIQKVNQVIEELDLLLLEFQKNDELEEAIEMMKTAKDEVNAILSIIKAIETENKSLTQLKVNSEVALINYIDGLHLQIIGIESWDVEHLQKGFQQTEKAKANLINLYHSL